MAPRVLLYDCALAAAEAGGALQALDDELREATRAELGNDYHHAVEWYADGLGGHCVVLAARIATRAVDVAGGAKRASDDAARVAADAERIVEGVEALLAASASAEDA